MLKLNLNTVIYHIFKTMILMSASIMSPLKVATKQDRVKYKNIKNASMHNHTYQKLLLMQETHVKIPVCKTILFFLKLY